MRKTPQFTELFSFSFGHIQNICMRNSAWQEEEARLDRLAARMSGGEDDAPGPATQIRPAKDFTQVLKTIQMNKVLPPPTQTVKSKGKKRKIENVFAKSALAANPDSELKESNDEAQPNTSTQIVSKISSQESDNKCISSKVSPIVSEPLAEKRAKGETDSKSPPVLSEETKSKLSSFRRVEKSDHTSQLQDKSGDGKQISSIAALALKKASKFKETLQKGCHDEKFEDEDEDDFNFCF